MELRLFVAHGVKDAKMVDFLLEEVKTHFSSSKNIELSIWHCRKDILMGEKWDETIQAGLAACDFGLLMVSPEFLRSDYIRKHELPKFVGPDAVKPLLPVGLKPVDFARQDLRGLLDHQIFRHEGRYFSELRSKQQKEAFAYKLYQAMHDRMAKVKAHV